MGADISGTTPPKGRNQCKCPISSVVGFSNLESIVFYWSAQIQTGGVLTLFLADVLSRIWTVTEWVEINTRGQRC